LIEKFVIAWKNGQKNFPTEKEVVVSFLFFLCP